MKNLKTRQTIALISIIGTFVLQSALYFVNIPEANAPIVQTGAGIIYGYAAAVISFYFGDSESKKDKSDSAN